MIPVPINTVEDLQKILKEHTGSPNITKALHRYISDLKGCKKNEVYYIAYTRGRTTLVLKQDTKGYLLVEVLSKVMHSCWSNGLHGGIFTLIEPLIHKGAVLYPSYRGGFRLDLTAPLSEPEIIQLFRHGWTSYDVNSFAHYNSNISLYMSN